MYDIVIENGKVIDGAGNPWISSNIAIKGDKIEEVSRRKLEAEITISANGLVVTPGLIDSHTHSDNTVLENNIGKNYLFQGVTTVVTGECGNSLYPLTPEYQKIIESKLRSRASDPESIEVDWLTLEDWRDKLEKRGLGVNHIPLIGHKTVRNQILDRDRSRSLTMPTQEEIESEKRIIERAMEDGSFGLSLNLSQIIYFPRNVSKF